MDTGRALYQVPLEHRCNRTFVTIVDETIYIQRANAEFRGGGDTESGFVLCGVLGCVQYPPLRR